MPDDVFLTVDEVAVWLKVSTKSIYRWVKKGTIPHVRVGGGLRFSQQDVTDWISDRKVDSADRRQLQNPPEASRRRTRRTGVDLDALTPRERAC